MFYWESGFSYFNKKILFGPYMAMAIAMAIAMAMAAAATAAAVIRPEHAEGGWNHENRLVLKNEFLD